MFPANQTISFASKAVKSNSTMKVNIRMKKLTTDSNWDTHSTVSDKYAKVNAEEALKDLHDTTQKINELFDALGENGAESLQQGIEAMNSAVEKINGFFDSLSESGITQGVNDAKDWLLGLFG
jgi:glycyl-tRNA synthetase beta subunit